MRIGIDVDDVLFPWFDKAHAVSEAAGITNGKTPTSWTCHEDYGVPLDVWVDVLQQATLDGTLYHGEPYPGAVAAMQKMADAGHSLHIVTARGFFDNGDVVRRLTIDWLKDNKIPHDTLTFTKDKTIINLDMAVDDSMKNVLALEGAGVDTWMMDAPHNLNEDYPWRVANMAEFADTVLLTA